MHLSPEKIEAMIYTVRNQRVMLDRDLAKLYGVETKALNQAIKRNIERFPADFMFAPNSNELADLRSQIVTLGDLNSYNHSIKRPPHLFTENGVAMLSSVLSSDRAIQINIAIMRTFTKLRSFIAMGDALKNEVEEFKSESTTLFKIVFERLDRIEKQITPRLPANRKKISLK